MATFSTTEQMNGLELNGQNTYSTSNHGSTSGINALIIESPKSNTVGNAAILARSGVPDIHRRVADNFMIIKKIFGFPFVQAKINLEEKEFLAKYDFNLLEHSTGKQIQEELSFLKKWSMSKDKDLQEASDKIITIRGKELKHLIATNYVSITSEVFNGYKVLEKYLEDVSKYSSER